MRKFNSSVSDNMQLVVMLQCEGHAPEERRIDLEDLWESELSMVEYLLERVGDFPAEWYLIDVELNA